MTPTATLGANELFAALSDRTRLRLLNLLRSGERCVCDLVLGLGAPQPTVSRHLAALRRAGLVRARRDGAWMHYRLADEHRQLVLRLFECLQEFSVDCREFPRDERSLRAARAARGCCD